MNAGIFLEPPPLQVEADAVAEGHRADGGLALLGVVAAQREQLLANVTGANLLLLAYPVENCAGIKLYFLLNCIHL